MEVLAATPALAPRQQGPAPPFYRPRNARATPLYQLFETYYEDVKALWEERFEKNTAIGAVSSIPSSLATSIVARSKRASPDSSAMHVEASAC